MTTDVGRANSDPWGLAIEPDGRIVTGGRYAGGIGGGDFALARFTINGAPDPSFGNAGLLTTDFNGGDDYLYGIAISPDASIVAAGYSVSGGIAAFALARYGERLYVQQDANWNVTSLTDQNGTVKERFIYDPYGSRTVLSPSWGTTTDAYGFLYGFQDGRTDPVTGNVKFGIRDYRPSLQRWLQEDIAYFDGANLYEAMGSNPAAMVDPSGMEAAVAADVGGEVGNPAGVDAMANNYSQQVANNYRCEPASTGPHVTFPLFGWVIPVGAGATGPADGPLPPAPPGYYWDKSAQITASDARPMAILQLQRSVSDALWAADDKLLAEIKEYGKRHPKTAPGGFGPAGGGGGTPGCPDPCAELLDEEIGTYDWVRGNSNGKQANHILQNAVYRDVIPRADGPSIGMEGNVFIEPDSAHAKYHQSLIEFFKQYRKGGPKALQTPTNDEFNDAIRQALIAAGCAPELAAAVTNWAKAYARAFGIEGGKPIPRLPGAR